MVHEWEPTGAHEGAFMRICVLTLGMSSCRAAAAYLCRPASAPTQDMMVQWESFQQLDHLAEGAFFWTAGCKHVIDRLGKDVLDELTHKAAGEFH